MSNDTPIHSMIDEMRVALDTKLYLVAVAVAVALPAICASLEMVDGRSQGLEYKEWVKANLTDPGVILHMTPEEIYSMRNGILHQGRTEIVSKTKAGIVQTAKHHAIALTTSTVMYSNMSIEGLYLTSVRTFCENIACAVEDWLTAQEGNEVVSTNLSKIMRYRALEMPMGIRIGNPNGGQIEAIY